MIQEAQHLLAELTTNQLDALARVMKRLSEKVPDGSQIDFAALIEGVRELPEAALVKRFDTVRLEKIRARAYELSIFEFIEDRDECIRRAETEIDAEDTDEIIRSAMPRVRIKIRRRSRC